MNQKKKNLLISILFPVLLAGFGLFFFLKPDAELSISERRKLKQTPELTAKALMDGSYFTDFEAYALDQFPMRETFRRINAFYRFRMLGQKDTNKIYLIGDQASKLEYPMNETYVLGAAKKFNALYDRYLSGMHVYYSVIPDKNYFLAKKNGYPSMDYQQLTQIMQENTRNMTYLDLFSSLTIDDYYRTDTHWKQDRLSNVLAALGDGMGFAAPDLSTWQANTYTPFYGVYCGQAALPIGSDTLTYLTGDAVNNASVWNYETNREESVYPLEKLNGMDPYDVFLGGAAPLLKITSPKGDPAKKLILFRDSYGSSLTPLLLEAYSEIWLVDIRYISSELLGTYIDFSDQDVLFLYSTMVINNSPMLK